MSKQFDDTLQMDNTKYVILYYSQYDPLNPKDLGLTPTQVNTASIRGYWCNYSVINNQLILSNLYIHAENYPDINGVAVAEPEYFIFRADSNSKEHRIPKYHGHQAYYNVDLPLDYTGKVLIGADRISIDDAPVGYHTNFLVDSFWKYKKLMTVSFSNGYIDNISDDSEISSKMLASAIKHFPEVDPRYQGLWPMDFELEKIALSELAFKPWWIKRE